MTLMKTMKWRKKHDGNVVKAQTNNEQIHRNDISGLLIFVLVIFN